MKILIAIILTLSVIGCRSPIDDDGGNQGGPKKKQEIVYFQYDYINYAWGFQHYGWYIDSASALRSYNFNDRQRSWNYPDSLGYISEADLLENLAQTQISAGEVHKDTLAKYSSLIETLGEEYSEPVQTAADAGSASFYAYEWDASKQMYKQILISQTGDWEKHNLSPHAEVLEAWLIKIGEANPPFFWLRD